MQRCPSPEKYIRYTVDEEIEFRVECSTGSGNVDILHAQDKSVVFCFGVTVCHSNIANFVCNRNNHEAFNVCLKC